MKVLKKVEFSKTKNEVNEMMTPAVEAMLFLQAIGGEPTVGYSEYTNKWYVHDGIEVGGDGLLASPTVHSESPEEAIAVLFEQYKAKVPFGGTYYLQTIHETRVHWQWNGACFVRISK